MVASINFNIQKQLMSNWCWAAVATSIFKYYEPGLTMTQGAVVSNVLQIPQCNTAVQIPPTCNKQGKLRGALTHLRIFADEEEVASEPGKIFDALSQRRPVALLLNNVVFPGHFVVVSRIDTTSSDPILTIHDPVDAGFRIARYSALRNGFQGSYWTRTYFTLRK